MANRLTMAKIQAIRSLHEQNWTNRKIARELDVDRETVAKYVRVASCVSKPAKAPIGSDGASGSAAEAPEGGAPDVPSGGQKEIEPGQPPPLADVPPGNSKPAKAPIGSEGSKPAAHGLRGGAAPIGSEAAFGAADRVPSSPGLLADVDASTTASALETEGSRSACEPYRQVILEKLEQGLSAQRIYQDLVSDGFDHEYHSVRRFVATLRRSSPLPFRRMECAAGEEAQVDFGTGA